MKLKSILIKNICSHKDTYYEFDKDKDVYLLLGKNGQGKSSFIGSISLALFGEDPYYGNVYNCIRMGSEQEGSLIELVFELGASEYKIQRKIKVTNSTKSTESYLYKDDTLFAGPKVKEFDNAVENLLSSKKVFLSSVFTSQNIAEDITEMPVSERTELLNKLWDLTFLQELSDKAKLEIKNINTTINEKNLIEARLIEEVKQEETFKNSLEICKNNIKKFTFDKEAKELELKQLQDKIKEVEELYNKKSEYNELLNKYTTITTKIDSLISENNIKREKITKEEDFKNQLSLITATQEDIDLLEKEKQELSDILYNEKNVIDKITNTEYMLNSLKSDIVEVPCNEQSCPYFTQMDERKIKKEELEKQVDILKNELKEVVEKKDIIKYNSTSEIQTKLSEIKSNLNKKNELISELNSISYIKESLEKNDIQIKEYQDNKIELELKLKTLDSFIKEMIENTDESIKGKVVSVKDELVIITKEYEDTLRLEGKYITSLEEISLKKQELETISLDLIALKKELKYFTIIKEDFSKKGIQSMVINSLKNELEKIIKDLLSNLSNNKFSITLSTKKELSSGEERESLEILVKDEQGVRDISKFSGGEKKLLKLIIRLSLSIYQSIKNKVNYGLFVLDEIFDAIDSNRRIEMIEIINNLTKNFEQILIVTHSDELQGYFQNTLEFVKDDYTKIK